jgi:cell division protein FtsZ
VAQRAIASPLLEAGAIDGARGILINITGSSSLKLAEVNEASTIIQSAAHEDANIIFGAVLDEKMKDEIKITVIATGFKSDQAGRRERTAAAAAAEAVSHARTAPAFVPSPPEPVVQPTPVTPPVSVMQQRPAHPQRESTSIADVKGTVKTSYEEDDLDVPAFIRKRNEAN